MAKKWLLTLCSGFFSILLLLAFSFAVLAFEIPDDLSVFKGEELPSYPCFSLTEEKQGTISAKMFGVIPVKEIEVKKYDKISLIPGGFVFGVKVLSEGVTVAGFSDVTCGGVSTSPAREAGICVGDLILRINGAPVGSTAAVTKLVEENGDAPMEFLCRRGAEERVFTVHPKKSDTDGRYKTGVWVRDSSSGIGTVTFVDPKTGAFGGLGHGICDGDSGNLLSFRRGTVTGVRISGVTPGAPGAPGEIRGALLSEKWGSLLSNSECGVFGVFQSVPAGLGPAIPVGLSSEVKCGDASILATLADGQTRSYSVKITAIHHKEGTKCFSVKVTDPALLSQSGGIVQGMSGSPIIQNGKLVGAVTHVLINDPTTGYGIFIENMLNASEIARNELPAA